MPKISVIIPVYRVENTLRRCVDSVLSQTFTDIEIILVDDGSPDSCGEICDSYAAEDKRVTVIHRENGGLSSARNTGLAAAKGQYVMFLDSDDYVTEDCLTVLSAHEADMVIGTIAFAFDDGRIKEQKPRDDSLLLPDDYLRELPGLFEERRLNYVHAKLFRMQLIRDRGLSFEDDMLTSAEDTVFNFTFLRYCRSIYISSKPVHFYMQYDNGLAKRFYPDRYDRYSRLNRFITSTCREMDILSEEMQAEIDRRILRSAVWSIEGIIQNRELSTREKRELLDHIREDEALHKAYREVRVEDTEDLHILLFSGSQSLLRSRSPSYRKLKSTLAKITPRRLKDAVRRKA